MNTSIKSLLAFALAFTLVGTSSPVLADSQMIDLGTLGGNSSVALDINNNNQIVGVSNIEEDGEFHAFLWENGVMTDLTPGYESYASAINQNGQIVGSSYMTGDQHATLWTTSGEEIDLGTLYGYESVAYDINENGQIVGSFSHIVDLTSLPRAFLWDDGVMIDLGTLGGNASVAYSINDRGEVVGFSTNADGISRPFIWKDGLMTDLGTLGGDLGSANGINASGRIIGSSTNVQGQSKPTLWFHNSTIELSFPFQNISMEHISNSGIIIGTYSSLHAFIWVDDEFIALGTLGGRYSFGYSVNDNRYAVGRSSNEDGEGHAFLWMP